MLEEKLKGWLDLKWMSSSLSYVLLIDFCNFISFVKRCIRMFGTGVLSFSYASLFRIGFIDLSSEPNSSIDK